MKKLSEEQKNILQEIGFTGTDVTALCGQKMILWPNTPQTEVIMITSASIKNGTIIISIPTCIQVPFFATNPSNRKSSAAVCGIQIEKTGDMQLISQERGGHGRELQVMLTLKECKKEIFSLLQVV